MVVIKGLDLVGGVGGGERESCLDELCLTCQMENKMLEVELTMINKHNLMLKLVFW